MQPLKSPPPLPRTPVPWPPCPRRDLHPCIAGRLIGLPLSLVATIAGARGANATYRTAHFTFTLYEGLSAEFAIPIDQAAEDSYRRVLNDLGVSR
jgi:hypothetical protein